MRLVLFGYGAMGQLVRTLAMNEGHDVPLVLNSRAAEKSDEELEELLRGHDAAIDFSVGKAVVRNVSLCSRAAVPLVEGATGWNSSEAEVRRIVEENDGALIFGANFSIGVNVFYRIVERAGELFQGLEQYAPFIEEAHHARKRDAPSGTALRLKDLVAPLGKDIPIASTRAGYIPGTHVVGFDSDADQITLTHTARSREGLARGALLAARWIVGRKGTFEFSEMLDEVFRRK